MFLSFCLGLTPGNNQAPLAHSPAMGLGREFKSRLHRVFLYVTFKILTLQLCCQFSKLGYVNFDLF